MIDLIHWTPFIELKELANISNFFDRFINRSLARQRITSEERLWSPLIDVVEKKDCLVVKAELPGIDKKDVKVSVEDNTLIIRGETKKEKEVKEKDYYYYNERTYGNFYRTISLPVAVEKDKAKASYKNGILTIELPKKDTKSTEIDIQVE